MYQIRVHTREWSSTCLINTTETYLNSCPLYKRRRAKSQCYSYLLTLISWTTCKWCSYVVIISSACCHVQKYWWIAFIVTLVIQFLFVRLSCIADYIKIKHGIGKCLTLMWEGTTIVAFYWQYFYKSVNPVQPYKICFIMAVYSSILHLKKKTVCRE